MPDVPVSLTPWFDAKDNPPEAGRVVLTDEGMARSWPSGRVWEFDLPDMEGPCNPTVWCAPSPPGTNDPLGPLTIADLRLAAALLAGRVLTTPEDLAAAAARLRRALDQIGDT